MGFSGQKLNWFKIRHIYGRELLFELLQIHPAAEIAKDEGSWEGWRDPALWTLLWCLSRCFMYQLRTTSIIAGFSSFTTSWFRQQCHRILKCCPVSLKELFSAQLFIICLFAYLRCVKTAFKFSKRHSRCFTNPLNSMHQILLLLCCQWPGTESKPVWGKLFSFCFNSLIRYVEL